MRFAPLDAGEEKRRNTSVPMSSVTSTASARSTRGEERKEREEKERSSCVDKGAEEEEEEEVLMFDCEWAFLRSHPKQHLRTKHEKCLVYCFFAITMVAKLSLNLRAFLVGSLASRLSLVYTLRSGYVSAMVWICLRV